MEKYIIIYQVETDGDIKVDYMTPDEIELFAKGRHYSDYAIAKGTIIKDFDRKINFKNIKKKEATHEQV